MIGLKIFGIIIGILYVIIFLFGVYLEIKYPLLSLEEELKRKFEIYEILCGCKK